PIRAGPGSAFLRWMPAQLKTCGRSSTRCGASCPATPGSAEPPAGTGGSRTERTGVSRPSSPSGGCQGAVAHCGAQVGVIGVDLTRVADAPCREVSTDSPPVSDLCEQLVRIEMARVHLRKECGQGHPDVHRGCPGVDWLSRIPCFE